MGGLLWHGPPMERRSTSNRATHQTVFRAELLAVIHAIRSAVIPTCVVSDCMSVVDLVRDELRGIKCALNEDHTDLKRQLRDVLEQRQQHEHPFFDIRWVHSHIPTELADELEQGGGFPAIHVRGNDGADNLARGAMISHPISWMEYHAADDQEFLAVTTQMLIEHIWCNVFEADQELKSH